MKSGNPLFSVIIPAYNYADSLARALESVLGQAGNDYEVLIVDDGSTDNTSAVIERLLDTYPKRFRAVTRSNAGPAATRNYGIEKTTGEWLIFLDADDELMPDALNELRRFIEQNSGIKLVIGGHVSVSSDGRECYRGAQCLPADSEKRFVGYLLKKSIQPCNGATAMHRDIFATYRYPEQFRHSEDIVVFSYALVNFHSAALDKAINRVYHHDDSLRYNIDYADAVGIQLVDEVFNRSRIPDKLQRYKRRYAGQRCLSLFRTFYLAGKKKQALKYYREALRNDWRAFFKLSYTKKMIRLLIN